MLIQQEEGNLFTIYTHIKSSHCVHFKYLTILLVNYNSELERIN